MDTPSSSEQDADVELTRQAFRRVKDDFSRVFVPRKTLFGALDSATQTDRDKWCLDIAQNVRAGRYAPSAAVPILVPKKDSHYRPGKVMSPDDIYAYNFGVLALLPKLCQVNDWSSTTVRFSYRAADAGGEWFKWGYSGWKNFDRVSLGKLHNRTHAVVADIAGYYENIDITRLMREVKALTYRTPSDSRIADSLSSCLNKWNMPRGRGIPQGMAPSHVLAELFLDPVDRAMKNEGFDHVRYLDDIRIFCTSEREAISALHKLGKVLDIRGLNLQSAKSRILNARDAARDWSQVRIAVRSVSDKIAAELQQLQRDGEYVEEENIARFLADPNLSKPEPEVIEGAWTQFRAGNLVPDFDKTLYHYLLGRLGDIGSPIAVSYSVSQLTERPEETAPSLKYLQKMFSIGHIDSSALDQISHMLHPDNSPYDYQRYLILEWLSNNQIHNEIALRHARNLVQGFAGFSCAREAALEYVSGVSPTAYDFNLIETSLAGAVDTTDRIMHILSLRHLPKPFATEILGRVAGENTLMELVAKFVRKELG